MPLCDCENGSIASTEKHCVFETRYCELNSSRCLHMSDYNSCSDDFRTYKIDRVERSQDFCHHCGNPQELAESNYAFETNRHKHADDFSAHSANQR